MGVFLSGGKKLMESTVAHARNFSKEVSSSNILTKINSEMMDKINPINLSKKRWSSLTDKFKGTNNSNLHQF